MEDDGKTYRTVRHYFNPRASRTLRRGLTLEQAQAHCQDPESSSETCVMPQNLARTKKVGPWFDGYTAE